MNLIYKLYNKGFISDYFEIKKDIFTDKNYIRKNEVAVKKFICSRKNLPTNWDIISKNWISAWHGTQFEYLESIVENGLKLPGSRLKDGKYVPKPKDIPLKDEVSGIKNWEMLYLLHKILNLQYIIVMELMIKKCLITQA